MNFNSEYSMTIDGRAANSSQLLAVRNPACGDIFAHAPDCGSDQLDAAVVAANSANRDWRELAHDRRPQAFYISKE